MKMPLERLTSILVATISTVVAYSQTWNAREQFDSDHNPTTDGSWQYGSMPVGGGEFSLIHEQYLDSGWVGWYRAAIDGAGIMKARPGNTIVPVGSISLTPGGQYPQDMVVRWTAPATAYYYFDFVFTGAYAGTNALADVALNGLSIYASGIHGQTPYLWGFLENCGAGSTVDWRVSNVLSAQNRVILEARIARIERSVSGTVNFESLAEGASVPAEATFNFFDPGNGRLLVEIRSAIDSMGRFSIPALEGRYRLGVKVSHWLQQSQNIDTTLNDVTGMAYSVINGDVDGDNEVTLADYALLASAFSSVPGDGNWNADADLDGDGEVTLADYSILAASFGLSGD